jgi:hypothetical protein
LEWLESLSYSNLNKKKSILATPITFVFVALKLSPIMVDFRGDKLPDKYGDGRKSSPTDFCGDMELSVDRIRLPPVSSCICSSPLDLEIDDVMYMSNNTL